MAGAIIADGYKTDLWSRISAHHDAIPELLMALRNGRTHRFNAPSRFNRTLGGTLARIEGTTYEGDEDGPIDHWLEIIGPNDKPGDPTYGGFAAQKVIDWIEEYCSLNGVTLPNKQQGAI